MIIICPYKTFLKCENRQVTTAMTYQENQTCHKGIIVSFATTLTFSLGTKSFKGESGSKANVVGVLAGRALRFLHGFPEKFHQNFPTKFRENENAIDTCPGEIEGLCS